MSHITIHELTTFDQEEAEQIGALMPQLDGSFNPHGTTEDHINRWFIGSPERSILVARLGETVVGTAVMQTDVEQTPDSLAGRMGGFVVDERARGTDTAPKLWRYMQQWCRERDYGRFDFNTENDRKGAVRFYRRMGARLVEHTDSHYQFDVARVSIPGSVREAFGKEDDAVFTPVQSGLTNQTYIVDNGPDTTVLQTLNPSFDKSLLLNSMFVAEHLESTGWEAPTVIPTTSGSLSYEDEHGNTWRELTYIASDRPLPEDYTKETSHEIGALLGAWHKEVSQLDYEPQGGIPHFHDTRHFAEKLGRYRFSGKLHQPQELQSATRLLARYDDLPPLPESKSQIIHGDPQLSNMLFRDKKPFTLIDLDTIMKGSIWLDIGDLLRSKAEDDIKNNKPVDIEALCDIAEGYRAEAEPTMQPEEFRRIALLATKTIATELAMRFVIDIADGNYFEWDRRTFANRQQNHLYRSGIQEHIIDAIEARGY